VEVRLLSGASKNPLVISGFFAFQVEPVVPAPSAPAAEPAPIPHCYSSCWVVAVVRQANSVENGGGSFSARATDSGPGRLG
jgi:hypothetical protein